MGPPPSHHDDLMSGGHAIHTAGLSELGNLCKHNPLSPEPPQAPRGRKSQGLTPGLVTPAAGFSSGARGTVHVGHPGSPNCPVGDAHFTAGHVRPHILFPARVSAPIFFVSPLSLHTQEIRSGSYRHSGIYLAPSLCFLPRRLLATGAI